MLYNGLVTYNAKKDEANLMMRHARDIDVFVFVFMLAFVTVFAIVFMPR